MAVPEAHNDLAFNQQAKTAQMNGVNGKGSKQDAIYLVRVPKPAFDDSVLTARQDQFKAMVDKLRVMNDKGVIQGKGSKNAKRAEQRDLRARMSEARRLKDESDPEFQVKANSVRELKKYRQGFVDQIKEIMSLVQGTDLRSEAALDERIREMEGQISHGGLTLREEKQVVQNVSRLQALRPKLKEFDACKEALQYAEAESQKLKAVLADMESEFSILKSEREAANSVVLSIQKQIQSCSKALEEMDEDEKEMVKAKDDAYEALQQARKEKDAVMMDYRENRRFALQVRDLVASGQHEEARQLAAAQVEEWTGKLISDPKLRANYQKLWSEQRKYAVSELLPTSSLIVQQEAAAKATPPSKQGKGKKAEAAPAAVRPSGAEQAKSLIESLMAQAKTEAAAAAPRTLRLGNDEAEADGPLTVGDTGAPQNAKQNRVYAAPNTKEGGAAEKKELPRFVENPNAAALKNKVPLPKEYFGEQDVFVPPVEASKGPQAAQASAESEAQRRERLREEQRVKAAEAEERKKKRAEVAERKKVAAVAAAKRAEQEKREKDAIAVTAGAEKAAGPRQEAKDESAGEPLSGKEDDQPVPKQQQQSSASSKRAAAAERKRQASTAAKRPKPRSSLYAVHKVWQRYQYHIVLGVVLLAVLVFAAFSVYHHLTISKQGQRSA